MLVLWMLFVCTQYWHTERYKVCGNLPSATHCPSLLILSHVPLLSQCPLRR